ncbi:hypothetical protein [Mucilaginibacter gotjawali]|uniref:Uncharacterized protein n=2 Tax=Mucilaginibacter gotjawali TaxID=1550579 RepID=A0A839SLI0_9SPHI|nr:hypothetical protein [Mucilaginibacter gotjawali]MBB3057379.1 hypothetical protein [Mucilaginibacter gotjawali]BAU55502.1 hypothetical protein MgSA37_03691 [Mucilaginibacter gotjawali]
MINLAIAYDDNDNELGEYFEESFQFIRDAIDNSLISLHAIPGLDCNEANISACVLGRAKPSIFAGLSHGNSEVLGAGEIFVSVNNCHHFDDTFFYTTGCCAAIELGPALISKGCRCFVGYTDVSFAPDNEDFNAIYIECETYCLKEFLCSEKTIEQAFLEMLDLFDNKIDEFFDMNEIVAAMDLQTNKDRLIPLGDTSLTRKHFIPA